MFADLLRRLTAPAPEPLPYDDARLALAALLVRIARADGVYEEAEIARIDAVLSSRYALTPFEVAKVRGEAEALEAEAPDTVRFTRAIKEAVPYEDRVKVIEALWDIVLADGDRDHEEDAILRLVAPMLGVNDRDSNLARQRVEARSG
ncbi:TerB family tellurite resistance protein [Roseicyclus sp.]|uniref:tellurite resistance TerB family protein n=1 Tax=Roseicyclus sp. TaxID=1914329 RepID=UPI003FA12383